MSSRQWIAMRRAVSRSRRQEHGSIVTVRMRSPPSPRCPPGGNAFHSFRMLWCCSCSESPRSRRGSGRMSATRMCPTRRSPSLPRPAQRHDGLHPGVACRSRCRRSPRVTKDPAVITEDSSLGDQDNTVFSGTAAIYGHGKAVVTARTAPDDVTLIPRVRRIRWMACAVQPSSDHPRLPLARNRLAWRGRLAVVVTSSPAVCSSH